MNLGERHRKYNCHMHMQADTGPAGTHMCTICAAPSACLRSLSGF